ncbi:hypothetical protein [Pseudonocardia sp.]|jgi:hypothetical protein|uniref:hypothetical protein n=1 Tax=Pseudonocardia sp. TaxID=60912 RepID=UPI0031FC09D4
MLTGAAGAGSSPQGKDFVGGQVVGVQDGPDVEHDTGLEPTAVGKHLDDALGAVNGIDSDEAVVGGWPVGIA